MPELLKMTDEELYSYISKMSDEELYSYIRSENTDIRLLDAIAKAVTYYCDDFYDLLSTVNLPQINILLEDKSLSSKFLDCLERVLLSNYDNDTSMYLGPLEKIFEHPNTTQEMLRNAYIRGFRAYVIDKLDKDESLNRKILKEIKNTDLDPYIIKQASQILKEDSSAKPKVVAVLINLNSLMQEFICHSNRDFQALCDYNITGSLLQKLSLLLEELSKFREQIGVEKLIFIPVFSEIYEHYSTKLDKYELIEGTGRWIPPFTREQEKCFSDESGFLPCLWPGWDPYIGGTVFDYKKLPRDYVLFDEHLDFCKWFCSCIAKIVNDGYINKEGNTIKIDNIIFDTGIYSDGYIKVEKLEKYGNFNITRRYIKDRLIKDGIVNYIDELTIDYKLLQVVYADIIKSSTELSSIDCLPDEDVPVSIISPSDYYQMEASDFYNLNGKIYFNAKNPLNYTEITNDGVFSDVSDDDNYCVKIFADSTFSVSVVEKGFNGLIQCFQYLNAAKKEYQELIKQGNAKVLTRKN